MRYIQWSGVTKPDTYGWAIVHTAKWCHYRKGERCTVPFPKGELCTMENCPMRPDDFLDMFPGDYQRLDSDNAALRAQVEELKGELERERMRLAACGAAALGVGVSDIGEEYLSASLSDVLSLFARASHAEAELARMTEREAHKSAVAKEASECALLAQKERDEARAQCERLEWLLEVERFWYSHPGNGSCWWDSTEREHSTAEAKAVWQAALAECGEGA